MKFPTPYGIGVCEGIQTLSRETYRVATSFRSEQPKYPPNTFPLGPDVPEKLAEFDDWMVCGTVDYGYLTGAIPLGSLDPRDDQFSQRGAPVEDLEEIEFDPEKPGKTFKIGRLLLEPFRTNLIEFLRAHKGDFAWTHHDIPGIDPSIAVHKLNEDPDARPIKQKRRSRCKKVATVFPIAYYSWQAVADFILEFIASDSPPSEASNEEGNDDSPEWETSAWVLFVDGASNKAGSGGGVVLQNPSRKKITRAFKFDFTVTNNEAEYEALITGLRMAKDLDVQKIVIFCDSQLVVNQITDTFGTKGPRLATYLQFAKDLVYCFESFQILHVPREANTEADRLARIGSGQDIDPLCPIIILSQSSLDRASVNLVEEEGTWMTPIIRYLVTGELPIDKNEARKLRRRSAHYAYKYEQLYKRGYSVPLLKCITPKRGLYVMQEIHEGVCGNHSGPRSLFHKVILQGYYWPTIKSDAEAYVQACEPCQHFSRLTHQPAELLNSVLSPWPFAKWGVDLIGPLPQGKYKMKFAIVAIDYYTKWVEAEPLQEITEARTTGFIWRNIICRFGIPHSLVSDNGTQFDSAGLKKLCLDLGIHKHFSSVAYPQSNGQVEAVNKTIKNNLERKLNGAKGRSAWSRATRRPDSKASSLSSSSCGMACLYSSTSSSRAFRDTSSF
ncbi:hypothetical protein UlMin_009819 [Ulmus minor]